MTIEELRPPGPAQGAVPARSRDGRKVLHAVGVIDSEGIVCHVETHLGVADAGLHPASGGDGTWACSGDMLLQSLVACAGVTLAAVAKALGIEIRAGRVVAEGDLDFRGTLGVGKSKRRSASQRYPAAVRGRDRCDPGADGEPASPDRALLRDLSDSQESAPADRDDRRGSAFVMAVEDRLVG